jgi:putative salt-induced outer membrane protein YdiY
MSLKKLCLLAATLLLSAHAFAEDTPQANPWQGSAALSYIVQNGNSDSQAVYGKGDISHQWQKWMVSLKGEGGSTRSRDDTTDKMVRTAEKYYAELREERKLDEANYLYHLSTFLNDNFSGYDYQVTDSLGYGRRIFKTDSQQLDGEIGPGYRVRKLEDNDPVHPGDKEESGVLHLGMKYAWQITESSKFTETAQDDIAKTGGYTVRTETSLTTMLNSSLAFSVTHLLTYNSEVPDGIHKTDSQVTLSLVYKLK